MATVIGSDVRSSSRKWRVVKCLNVFVLVALLLTVVVVGYRYTRGGTTKTEVTTTTTEEFNQLLASRAADDKKLNESFQNLTKELKIAKEEAAATEEQVEALIQAIHVLTPKKSK